MEKRTASWYSIVRYCPNNLSGEIVNVGIILHSSGEKIITKYHLIDENSLKIRAITDSQVELNTYKTYKETLEYYLKKSIENPFGAVGEFQIASPTDEKFLLGLHDHYDQKKLTITKPKFSLTGNLNGFFNNLFETYVGKKYLIHEHKHVSVKRYMKSVFEEQQLLDKKIVHDFTITPIKDLDNIKLNIDFGYKNGVWNYLQAIPTISGPSKNAEWFAKTKFMFENLDKDTKVHLLYRTSEVKNEKDFLSMLNYLGHMNNRISKLDLDDRNKVQQLCNIIRKDAHDVDELMMA